MKLRVAIQPSLNKVVEPCKPTYQKLALFYLLSTLIADVDFNSLFDYILLC